MPARLPLTRLLLLPLVALAVFSHHLHAEGSGWDRAVSLSGLVLLLVAMGGRIWANVYVLGRKDRVLVTEGPFSLTRNPLYLFSLLGFVGVGLALESVFLAGLFAVVFFATHWPTIHAEERKLEALFGAEYRAYRTRVPRFTPALRLPKSGGELTVDMMRFRYCLRDCLAIPLVFVAAELLEWSKLAGTVPVFLHLP
jgi:protein-S-isoprenylcysteine O-methyltransferase Ste14